MGVITAPAMGIIQDTIAIFSLRLKLQLAADASLGSTQIEAKSTAPTSTICVNLIIGREATPQSARKSENRRLFRA